MDIKKEALRLHEEHKGKLEIKSKVPLKDKKDLSLAYTPGVAEPCLEIHRNRELVYKYTFKSNMVAVVSDGSAVLGLGNIGAEAALPVMEGKCLLFKAFGDVDAFPICVSTQKSEEIVYSIGEEKEIQLDKTDHDFLKLLNKEGRKSLIDIAKQLKVSADTIKYRLNNLKKRGIITGFGVKIDYKKLDNHYYLIFLKLQNMNLQKYTKLESLARINKNVIIFIKTIGDHDIELEVETTNNDELDELMKTLRDHFVSEIKDYEILEVTREHRMTYYPF